MTEILNSVDSLLIKLNLDKTPKTKWEVSQQLYKLHILQFKRNYNIYVKI